MTDGTGHEGRQFQQDDRDRYEQPDNWRAISDHWNTAAEPMIQTYGLVRRGQTRRGSMLLRRPAIWYGGLALLGVVLAGALILFTLPAPQKTQQLRVAPPTPSATAQATATAVSPPLPSFALPAFGDWRAAYLTPDGMVHVVSMDGVTDLSGPQLQINTDLTTNREGAGEYTSMGVAPNGRYLAYINALPLPSGAGVAPPDGFLALINLSPDNTASGWSAVSIAGDLDVTHIAGWSPDSTRVAVDATLKGVHGIYVANPPDAQLVMVPQTDDSGTLGGSRVLGWLDNTHLLLLTSGAGSALPPVSQAAINAPAAITSAARKVPLSNLLAPRSSNGDLPLATVDVATGTAYEITRVSEGTVVALSPDGKEIEAYNSGCDGTCAAIAPEVVDTATGQIHQLPNSGSSLSQEASALWQPGTASFVATMDQNNQITNTWQTVLVDTQQDTARPLQAGEYAVAWSPDGQALLLGDATGLANDQIKLTVVSFTGGATVTLPQPMGAFIGFVKTA